MVKPSFTPMEAAHGFISRWKHTRQNPGFPAAWSGTVVSSPHEEQSSVLLTRPLRDKPNALARFDLHALQRLGSFLNCLSWKNSCSPAVNMKSAPQSTHFRHLSWNSMRDAPFYSPWN